MTASSTATTIPRTVGRVLFALFFIGACWYHFKETNGFADMLPNFVRWKLAIIYVTGIVELGLALMLFIPSKRRLAGVIIAWYLVLIFPANIYAAIQGIPAPGSSETSHLTLWIRLLFQPLLIWWILWATRYKQKSLHFSAPSTT